MTDAAPEAAGRVVTDAQRDEIEQSWMSLDKAADMLLATMGMIHPSDYALAQFERTRSRHRVAVEAVTQQQKEPRHDQVTPALSHRTRDQLEMTTSRGETG